MKKKMQPARTIYIYVIDIEMKIFAARIVLQFIETLSQPVPGDVGLCLKTACLIELNCAVC